MPLLGDELRKARLAKSCKTPLETTCSLNAATSKPAWLQPFSTSISGASSPRGPASLESDPDTLSPSQLPRATSSAVRVKATNTTNTTSTAHQPPTKAATSPTLAVSTNKNSSAYTPSALRSSSTLSPSAELTADEIVGFLHRISSGRVQTALSKRSTAIDLQETVFLIAKVRLLLEDLEGHQKSLEAQTKISSLKSTTALNARLKTSPAIVTQTSPSAIASASTPTVPPSRAATIVTGDTPIKPQLQINSSASVAQSTTLRSLTTKDTGATTSTSTCTSASAVTNLDKGLRTGAGAATSTGTLSLVASFMASKKLSAATPNADVSSTAFYSESQQETNTVNPLAQITSASLGEASPPNAVPTSTFRSKVAEFLAKNPRGYASTVATSSAVTQPSPTPSPFPAPNTGGQSTRFEKSTSASTVSDVAGGFSPPPTENLLLSQAANSPNTETGLPPPRQPTTISSRESLGQPQGKVRLQSASYTSIHVPSLNPAAKTGMLGDALKAARMARNSNTNSTAVIKL